MALFKCKMCGGALEINQNDSITTCEYCGTQQTLPKLNDERRTNLYDRANHFRRNNEFDKAMGIYEQILTDDNTDAEAYWSLVLCRYGIEYVEDPSSHKRIPTVNRAQYTSVFDDDNYKSALQYADGYQRHIYEEEAKAINEIQKGILAISQKEEPFDVFICYKETDNNGRRTPDSVLANELYHQLTQEGFKVFFSRITLEDKLGSAYEPYIFAALNSAKVMVVLGTKPEYFKAVWVRNEWSRYLSLIKQGQKKMLIPAYKDMDPYDLPDEFSHLQAQDMSKLGFMQDLIRGIKKIIGADESKTTVIKETVFTGGNANVAPLLKRVFIFLEDGDWNSANEYCEKVLDMDPENAQAYLGKLMAELRVRNQKNLKDCKEAFDGRNNYQKVLRYADDELKATIQGYVEYIKNRNELARLEEIYTRAQARKKSASTEDQYIKVAELYETIPEYKDSIDQAKLCREKAEMTRKDSIYMQADALMDGATITNYEEAKRLLKSIPGWKDSYEMILSCERTIEEIKAQEEADRLEAERKAEEERRERERQEELDCLEAKRKKKVTKIVSLIICVVAAAVAIWYTVIVPNNKYNDAIALMDAEEYDEAISAFTLLNGYKDSIIKIEECNTAILDRKYDDALALMNAEKYDEAIDAFTELDGHKDSLLKIKECVYNIAKILRENGEYDRAYEMMHSLDGYKDSEEQARLIFMEKFNEEMKFVQVGDYITFGSYEQDNIISNGTEKIEWKILKSEDSKILVVSKYALDYKQYNEKGTDATWETCTLRQWLNTQFFNEAFTEDERSIISIAEVLSDTSSQKITEDHVFLLSLTEVNEYFGSNVERQCVPTVYTDLKGVGGWTDGYFNWWTRSSAFGRAMIVYSDGSVFDSVEYISDFGRKIDEKYAVRPALWIDLDS